MACRTRPSPTTYPQSRRAPLLIGCMALLLTGSVAEPETVKLISQQTFDTIIVEGRVVDGTGNPWFFADIGIRGEAIAVVGNLSDAAAATVIDATRRIVVPGFIDLHSHADEGRVSLANPEAASAPNLVTQGITTVVVGQDGRCQCPVGERAVLYRRQGVGVNVVQLVGHGSIRQQVMGREARQSTPQEVAAMADLVRQAMNEGADGLSSGLEYNPGRYSITDEVIELAGVVAEFGGFYISHERSEGRTPMWWLPSMAGQPPDLIDAVLETIRIGEATSLPVVASHIKVKGADYWGTAPTVTRMMREARACGVQVYADQYPYTTTGSDGNTTLIPSWALDDGSNQARGRGGVEQRDFGPRREAFRRRLDDPQSNAKIRTDISHEISRRGGADKLLIIESHNPDFVGLHLSDIAATQSMDPVDIAIMLQLEGLDRAGGVRIRGFSLDERDVEHYMAEDFTATSTAAGIALPGVGLPHPRFYGTYPRKLHRYVFDGGVISLSHAIRSSTSLPAQIAGLARRGLVREGYAAGLVVLDPAAVADHATAMNPHQYSTGIDEVLVNGRFAVRDGQPAGVFGGQVLEGDEFIERRVAPSIVAAPNPLPPRIIAAPAR